MFKRHDFEPGEFLIKIANGTEDTGEWDDRDRLKAAQILMQHTYDKPQRESELQLIEQLRELTKQTRPVYEIVYADEDHAPFALPAAPGAASAP